MVSVADENTVPLQWPLGRVTEVFTGNDNIARVAEIRTQKWIGNTSGQIMKITRPVTT